MPGEGVLPPVEGSLVWSVKQFLAANDEAIASLRELAAETEATASKIRASTAEMAGSETAAADETAAASARMGEEQALSSDASAAAAAKGVKADEELGASHSQLANDASNLAGASRTASEDVTTATEDMSAKGVAADEKLSKAHGQVANDVSNLAGSTSKSSKEIGSSAESGSSKAGSAFQNLGKWALLGGAAVGVASVKLAMDFQASMTQLVTGAGESQKNLAMVSAGILAMAPAVGQTADALSKGMYMIESAGFHGAAGLSVLKAAAEGAAVGNADLGTMANVVTSALNAYHLKGSAATQVTNELIATVASGKMHMQDLATSLSNVLPIAASVHLSFAQVGGAMATMTMQGMSARRASMNLANMLRAMVAPNTAASAEMKRLGLSANQIASDLGKQGLTGTLSEMTEAILKNTKGGSVMATGFADMSPAAKALSDRILAGTITTGQLTTALKTLSPEQAKQVTNFEAQATSATGLKQTFDSAMKTMTGGATGLNVALLLGGQNASTFAANVKTVGAAAHKTGTNVTGWNLVQKDLKFQLDQAKAGIDAMSIKLGQFLIPKIEEAIHVVTDITGWFQRNKIATDALGIAIGVVLTAAIEQYLAKQAKMVNQFRKDMQTMMTAIPKWVAAHRAGTAQVTADNEEQGASAEKTAATTTAANDEAASSTEEATAAIVASNEERIASNAAVDASEAGVAGSSGIAAIGEDAAASEGKVAGLTGSVGSMGAMLPIAGVAIAALGYSFWDMNKQAAAARAQVKSYMDGITVAASGALPQLSSKLSEITDKEHGLSAALAAGKLNVFTQAGAASQLGKAYDAAKKAMADNQANLPALGKALGLTGDQVTSLAKSLNINLDSALNQGAVTAQMSGALAKLAGSAGLTSQSLVAMANNTHTSLASVVSSFRTASANSSSAWSQFSAGLTSTTGQTAGQIKTFYQNQEKSGASFVTNIQKAISDGYNPAYINQLLQEGPAQASSLLNQLVSAQGTGIAGLMNQTQAALKTQGERMHTETQFTLEATKFQGTAMAGNLAAALALASALTSSNAAAQIAAVESKYHLGFGQVLSIAHAYGVALPNAALGQLGATNAAAATLSNAFTSGMTAGINGGINAVIAAAGNYSTQALNAARAAIKAKSPSEETRKLGQDFARGGAIGLLESMHLFSDAAAQMAHGGLAAMATTSARTAVGATAAGGGGSAFSGGGGGGTVVNFNGGIRIEVSSASGNAKEIAQEVRNELLRTTARQVGSKGLWGR